MRKKTCQQSTKRQNKEIATEKRARALPKNAFHQSHHHHLLLTSMHDITIFVEYFTEVVFATKRVQSDVLKLAEDFLKLQCCNAIFNTFSALPEQSVFCCLTD